MAANWQSGVSTIDGSGGREGNSQEKEEHLERPSSQRAQDTHEEWKKSQGAWPKSHGAAYMKDFGLYPGRSHWEILSQGVTQSDLCLKDRSSLWIDKGLTKARGNEGPLGHSSGAWRAFSKTVGRKEQGPKLVIKILSGPTQHPVQRQSLGSPRRRRLWAISNE